jgi:iron complex outermembrane receptor protein
LAQTLVDWCDQNKKNILGTRDVMTISSSIFARAVEIAAATLLLSSLPLPAVCAADAGAEESEDLTRLSLQDLANLQVTSVSKAAEGLQSASASIYVITHDDILRSGATSLMEALRLAPNILVTQVSATNYIIAARGLSGNPQAQNFSNKLLMLIDGRSVYTPLYSGIYSDAQDVLLEDVDRIEIISGPGATLWGANAMNGVINVITRASYLTQGSFVDAAAGNQEQDLGTRFGGQAGAGVTYRAYALGFHRAAEELPDGASANDGWTKGQTGFRSDWSTDQNSATLQGDVYRAAEQQFTGADGSIAGANVLGRYQYHTDRSALQVQAYVDQTERFGPESGGGGAFVLHTYDVEIQQSIEAGSNQRVVWGGGERVNSYAITNQVSLLFEPPRRNLTLGDAFVQDTLSLSKTLNLTAGFKMEDDPYWGWTPLPDVRAAWLLSEHATLWAAASKAIRSPTPFDDDVVEKIGPKLALSGNREFRPEQVIAYEAGTRIEASRALSISLAAFYNDYDDLRTVEPPSSTQFFPLSWANLMKGDTYGVEGWANWQIADWWRLSPGFTALREQLHFKPGASGILGTTQAGNDPSSHADLTSSMDLSHRVALDATLRYVGALPSPTPGLPHYYELNGRIGWRASDALDLSINGLNLLHARHFEYPSKLDGEGIYRSVMAEARVRF